MASYETYSPQDTASTTAVVEVAVAICLNALLSSTGRTPGGSWGTHAPPPPLCEMILSCPYYSGGEKSRIRRINMQYIFSSCFVAFSTPPPLPNAHYSSEINITSRGCQHTHLLSTMGVMQCDSSPLKNPCYDP